MLMLPIIMYDWLLTVKETTNLLGLNENKLSIEHHLKE